MANLCGTRYADGDSQPADKPCPAKIIISITKLGYNLEEGIKYCKDYVVCKGKERKELEKLYSDTEINKICEPSNNALDKLSDNDKDTLRAFIQSRSLNFSNKAHNSSAK